jgi:hypothetical protein
MIRGGIYESLFNVTSYVPTHYFDRVPYHAARYDKNDASTATGLSNSTTSE